MITLLYVNYCLGYLVGHWNLRHAQETLYTTTTGQINHLAVVSVISAALKPIRPLEPVQMTH